MQIKQGDIIEGIITRITKYGAFVNVNVNVNVNAGDITGMIHISEISREFVNDINEHLKINQKVKAAVIGIGEDGRLALSLKRLFNTGYTNHTNHTNKNSGKPPDFEDMMNKFKRDSDERMAGLKSLEPKKASRGNKNKKK